LATDSRLTSAMHTIAEEHKLYDPLIYTEYLEMKALLEKLSFLNRLCQTSGYYGPDDQMVNIMSDLFKYHKHRVNFENYKIRINDEVLTEASLEELV
jgi:hypothetical protein